MEADLRRQLRQNRLAVGEEFDALGEVHAKREVVDAAVSKTARLCVGYGNAEVDEILGVPLPQPAVAAQATLSPSAAAHADLSPRHMNLGFGRVTSHDIANAKVHTLPRLYARHADYLSRRAFTQMRSLDPRTEDPISGLPMRLPRDGVQSMGYAAASYPPSAPKWLRGRPRDGPGDKRERG